MIFPTNIRFIALRKVNPHVPDAVAIVREEKNLLGQTLVLLELEGGRPHTITLTWEEDQRWFQETIKGARLWERREELAWTSKQTPGSGSNAIDAMHARREYREWCESI